MNVSTLPSGIKVVSVADLVRSIKVILDDAFPEVWVAGEISRFKIDQKGHAYFTLKDADSKIDAAIWRHALPRLRFQPTDGLAVIVRAKVDVYVPYGSYKLIVDQMIPQGIGALELAFQQLKERLFGLGYFEPGRKKPLPAIPRRIAIVTSPTGAAIRDVLEILGRRWPAVEVVVAPVRVQGDGAAEEIAAAIADLNRMHALGVLPIDVVIVGRGGGSLEDLWAFNEEVVARAIFTSRIPIVSAVGHETDVTIADLVADVHALTPTDAATRVVPDREEMLDGLANFETRIHETARRRIDRARQKVVDLASRRAFRQPLDHIREQERRLGDWTDRLQRAGQGRWQRSRDRLEALAGRLEALSPLNILARGYSLTQTPDGLVVRSAAAVSLGSIVHTRLHEGRIVSRVESIATGTAGGRSE